MDCLRRRHEYDPSQWIRSPILIVCLVLEDTVVRLQGSRAAADGHARDHPHRGLRRLRGYGHGGLVSCRPSPRFEEQPCLYATRPTNIWPAGFAPMEPREVNHSFVQLPRSACQPASLPAFQPCSLPAFQPSSQAACPPARPPAIQPFRSVALYEDFARLAERLAQNSFTYINIAENSRN